MRSKISLVMMMPVATQDCSIINFLLEDAVEFYRHSIAVIDN
jgi:hypothetical protein